MEIKLHKLSKKFKKQNVLEGIDITMQNKGITCILGPSGCGKSTLVKMICGLLKPSEGEVRIDDCKVPNLKLNAQIGYMGQQSALYEDLSGYENLAFFGDLQMIDKQDQSERIKKWSTLLHMEDVLSKPVKTYSGGMRQRLSLMIALINNPQLLILDEPTVGIDPLVKAKIWDELHHLVSQGVKIVLTTHIMEEAMQCEELIMINHGKVLYQGDVDHVLKQTQAPNLDAAFIKMEEGTLCEEC